MNRRMLISHSFEFDNNHLLNFFLLHKLYIFSPVKEDELIVVDHQDPSFPYIKKDPIMGLYSNICMLFTMHYHEVILLPETRSSRVVGQQMTSMLSYLRLEECSSYRKFQTLDLLLLLFLEIQSRML